MLFFPFTKDLIKSTRGDGSIDRAVIDLPVLFESKIPFCLLKRPLLCTLRIEIWDICLYFQKI